MLVENCYNDVYLHKVQPSTMLEFDCYSLHPPVFLKQIL